MKIRTIELLALAALAASTGAHAAVVTFEPDDFAVVFPGDPARSVQGYDFTLLAGNDQAFFISGLDAPDSYVNSGSKNLYAANYAGLGITASNGGAFSLASFQLGGGEILSPENWASSIEVIGRVAGGGVLAANFVLPSTATMTTVTLGWSNLASFEIVVNPHAGSLLNGRDYTIDNLNVTAAVPEPQTLALMLAGLGAVGFVARRRKGREVRRRA
ncbi:hypothetical protein BH11PSE8_BH11PSE8_47850 [soil metagenome]